jgi:hypothetical protein
MTAAVDTWTSPGAQARMIPIPNSTMLTIHRGQAHNVGVTTTEELNQCSLSSHKVSQGRHISAGDRKKWGTLPKSWLARYIILLFWISTVY